jgi:hypothetical protein
LPDLFDPHTCFSQQPNSGLLAYKDPKDVKHRIDGLRKAGLPET